MSWKQTKFQDFTVILKIVVFREIFGKCVFMMVHPLNFRGFCTKHDLRAYAINRGVASIKWTIWNEEIPSRFFSAWAHTVWWI